MLIVFERDLQHYEVTFTFGTKAHAQCGTLALIPSGCEYERFCETAGRTPAYGIYTTMVIEYFACTWRVSDFICPSGLAKLQAFLLTPDLGESLLWGMDGQIRFEFRRHCDGWVSFSGICPDHHFEQNGPRMQLSMCCFMAANAAKRTGKEIGTMLGFIRQLEEDNRVHRRPFKHHL